MLNHSWWKHSFFLACSLLMLTIGPGNNAKAAADLDVFPSKPLPVPENMAQADYLGVDSEEQQFVVSDISADLVLIEVFSMYCPICQAEAGEVNRLFSLIREQDLEDRIKIIGIAPGNSAFEVGVFQKEYEIEFPLFPDPDYEWHDILGKVGTPYFITVSPDQSRILSASEGAFSSPEDFFEELKDELSTD